MSNEQKLREVRQTLQHVLDCLVRDCPDEIEAGDVDRAIGIMDAALSQPTPEGASQESPLVDMSEEAVIARCLPQPQAQGALTGCACRWDREGNRMQTCVRHQGWLDVVHEWAERAKSAEAESKSYREAIAEKDAALVACVEVMQAAEDECAKPTSTSLRSTITRAKKAIGGEEGD